MHVRPFELWSVSSGLAHPEEGPQISEDDTVTESGRDLLPGVVTEPYTRCRDGGGPWDDDERHDDSCEFGLW